MKVSVVLGLTFGDEGKGATTQWCCQQAMRNGRKPRVVRFNGGAQAAHTVKLNGEEHICSTYGSGVLLGVPTFLAKDFYFDPISACNEYRTLQNRKPHLEVHPDCRVVTPYDVIVGVNNSKVISDGTCGKGIFQTFQRYRSAQFDNLLTSKEEQEAVRKYLEQVRNYYRMEKEDELEELFVQSLQELPCTVTGEPEAGPDTELVYEGAQGLLLDMDYGFYPHVTPSHTGLDNVPEEHLQGANVYLVTRTYTTRHGNGYEPRQPLHWNMADKHETNVNNEFQGSFKTGMLEFGLIHRAIDRHHLDVWQRKYGLQYHLVVTHGDLALKNGYMDYLHPDGRQDREETTEWEDIEKLFLTEMEKAPLRFQSILLLCK